MLPRSWCKATCRAGLRRPARQVAGLAAGSLRWICEGAGCLGTLEAHPRMLLWRCLRAASGQWSGSAEEQARETAPIRSTCVMTPHVKYAGVKRESDEAPYSPRPHTLHPPCPATAASPSPISGTSPKFCYSQRAPATSPEPRGRRPAGMPPTHTRNVLKHGATCVVQIHICSNNKQDMHVLGTCTTNSSVLPATTPEQRTRNACVARYCTLHGDA